MATDNSLTRTISEEVHIAAHDRRWAEQFAAERDRLLDFLPGHFASIAHSGSTGVPQPAAKPVIDILAGVGTISEADALL